MTYGLGQNNLLIRSKFQNFTNLYLIYLSENYSGKAFRRTPEVNILGNIPDINC